MIIWGLILIVLVLAILVWPLWRQRKVEILQGNTVNIAVLKDQLDELQTKLANGEVTQAQYDQEKAALETTVAYDLDDGQSIRLLSVTHHRLLLGLILLFIPLSSVWLYQQLSPQPPQANSLNPDSPDEYSMHQVIEQLAAYLRDDPDNAKGWQMLGHAYMAMQRFTKASQAYERSYQLAGASNPELLVDYAEALAYENDHDMSGRPLELVNTALDLKPTIAKGLWLKGFADYQQSRYQAAIATWEKLLAIEGASNARQVNEGFEKSEQDNRKNETLNQALNAYIADAKARLRGSQMAQNAQNTQSTQSAQSVSSPQTKLPTATSITVRVSLDEVLQASVAQDKSVFVFAKSVSGPAMPLAVTRLTVADLPAEVKLTDAKAMIPSHRLSDYSKIIVGARVSQSGSPMAGPGDMGVVSDIIDLADQQSVSLLIQFDPAVKQPGG